MRSRRLEPDDRSAVSRLADAVFQGHETAVALELFDLGVGGTGAPPADPGYQWIGIDRDGQLAGCACFGPTPGTSATFDLYWIMVDPDIQGAGTGTQLLHAIERTVAAFGGQVLVVEASGTNRYRQARAFYARRGYQTRAVIRDYYAPGDDRHVLARNLPLAAHADSP